MRARKGFGCRYATGRLSFWRVRKNNRRHLVSSRDTRQAPLAAEKAPLMLMRSMGEAIATPHGFRTSFRNWCGEKTNFAREIIEMCLAHQIGNAVEQAYWRGDALEKRREVMEAWAAYVG